MYSLRENKVNFRARKACYCVLSTERRCLTWNERQLLLDMLSEYALHMSAWFLYMNEIKHWENFVIVAVSFITTLLFLPTDLPTCLLTKLYNHLTI